MSSREEYHLEFKYKGKWLPAYGTHLGKSAAEKAKKRAIREIEADTGEKESSKSWRIVSGPEPGKAERIRKGFPYTTPKWGQIFTVGTLLAAGAYFLVRA